MTNKIETSDSLAFLSGLNEYSNDIIYCDPPYALGSEVIIRKDGKVDYAKAADFMNKWEMPTGAYWEKWFTEAYRTLKHGGYLIMFGMDRQLLLFKYYAHLAGFVEQQSLYWYFISNFPKATDLSKMIDRNNGRTLEQYKELGKYIKESRGDKPQRNISKFFPSKTGNITGCVANWELGLNVPTMEQWKILKRELDLDNRFDELIEREEAEREVIGVSKNGAGNGSVVGLGSERAMKTEFDITKPSSDLAKKYEGYKYSISPLKQTNETIMVFQKPCKTGSPLHDTLAYENGDKTISVSALNIDGNRVEIDASKEKDSRIGTKVKRGDSLKYKLSEEQQDILTKFENDEDFVWSEKTSKWKDETEFREWLDQYFMKEIDIDFNIFDYEIIIIDSGIKEVIPDEKSYKNILNSNSMFGQSNIGVQMYKEGGRYPAQTFIDSQVAERLDLQSGVSKSANSYVRNTVGYSDTDQSIKGIGCDVGEQVNGYDDIGGCSKILHKCDYTQEDYDLYFYEPKVSSSERNAGCGDFDEVQSANLPMRSAGVESVGIGNDGSSTFRETKTRNNHPTLKPIALNEKILKLFKTPNDQKICYPFAGAGSEIIGGIKAGFDNWCGCEISQEYVDIANARIKYWKEEMSTQTTIFDFI